MKSKQQEINQFKSFLTRLEPGGYLDKMFRSLSFWVEHQIKDDLAFEISPIIKDCARLTYDLKQSQEIIESQNNSARIERAELDEAIEKAATWVQEAAALEDKLKETSSSRDFYKGQAETARKNAEREVTARSALWDSHEELEQTAISNGIEWTAKIIKLEGQVTQLKAELYDKIKEKESE